MALIWDASLRHISKPTGESLVLEQRYRDLFGIGKCDIYLID